MERTAILVLGHGSRRPCANGEVEATVEALRLRHPRLALSHAFIELAQPLLADELARLAVRADRVVVVPLFLFAAGHVKEELPRALEAARGAFPSVRFEASRVFGIHRWMLEVAIDRMRSTLNASEAASTVLVAVGRGTSDPEANGDFCKVVRLLGERGDFAWSEPSFIGVTGPRFEAVAERVALSAPERLLVLPYFLFAGRLTERLEGQVRAFAERHRGLDVRLAPLLGGHPRVLDVVDERLAEVLEVGADAKCVVCGRSAAA